MIDKISLVTKMFAETYVPHYAEKVVSTFWSNAENTHTDMSMDAFHFYYKAIKKIIQPTKDQLLLDYGCGSGEISSLFHREGFKIDCCDINPHFIDKAKQEGLNAFLCEELLKHSKTYHIIFINNAFFYIHPFQRKKFLQQLHKKLDQNGKLFILDEPDYEKRENLHMNPLLYAITALFPVYQIQMAGFFNKPYGMKKQSYAAGFKEIEKLDSWCNYRSHFILTK